jgi:predicted DCC family thiol-disulfide oxidoreductase YuxK
MTEPEHIEIEGRALLLYDGVCALCNGVVQFFLKHDKLEKLRYAPLQSTLGREILSRFGISTIPAAVILVTDALTPQEHLYQRSDAVGAALQLLPGHWRLLGKALVQVPRPLREFAYGVVARMRYLLFGRYLTCPIPAPNQRSRLLGVYE